MSWPRGHESLVRSFREVVGRGRLAHAYLFTGPGGVGKEAFAVALGKLLLCEAPAALDRFAPCGLCPACVQVDADTHPDFHYAKPPADAHEFPVQQMKELIGHLALKPARGSYRVAVVVDADILNEESANAFLKTLEEPPPHSLLVLVGTNPDYQLPTIRSRCQHVRFPPLRPETLADILLAEGLAASREESMRLARQSEGSLTTARALADAKLIAFRQSLIAALAHPRPDCVGLAAGLMQCIDEAGKESSVQRARAHLLLRFLAEFFRSTILLKEGARVRWTDPVEEQAAQQLAPRLETDDLLQALERCLQAEQEVDSRLQLVLVLEALVDDVAGILRKTPERQARL